MATQQKITCPYCNKKYERNRFSYHIADKHSNKIPEGWTPLRLAYHIINKRPLEYTRKCRVCGKPTDWDESKGRYNFLCNNPECKKKWVETMKKTMGDKMGSNRPTASEEGLKKMLAGRKISGKYKWSDGTIFTFTGSYEKEALSFMDKVLNVRSEDIEVPGPVLQYQFQNKTHMYITDIYYRPYNLIIEVKDGGSNPNTNGQYALTRAKQMAKEKYVIAETDYNYLRLTDKDMSQLLSVFADLKMHLVENDNNRVIHVNENVAVAAMNPMIGFNYDRDTIIVNYLKKNRFSNDSDYAIAGDPKFDTVFIRDNGKLIKTDKSVLENTVYTPYIIRDSRDRIAKGLVENLNQEIDKNYLYELAFEHPCLSDDQILFEENAIKYKDYYYGLKELADIVKESVELDPYDDKNIVTKRYGVIGDNGVYNCCVMVKGYPKPFRARSSMIILRKFHNKYQVLARYNFFKDDKFDFPGGGWDDNEDPKNTAIREAREEVHINVTDVKYGGSRLSYDPNKVQKWVRDHIDEKDWWYGYFTEQFIGMYDSKYNGKVDKLDQDSLLYTAKWWNVDDILKMDLYPESKKAIVDYISKREGLNESAVDESYLINEKDIYYNKDKFDSGEINLCFIIGHSGSGKSTMAHKAEKDNKNVEAYELDDLFAIKDDFTMEDLKKYGDLIYSFFNGPGKKYYVTFEYLNQNKIPGSEYEYKLYPDFAHYAMQYAKSHKDKKYIVEGVWLFLTNESGQLLLKPEEFKDYAFYIKGTSAIISAARASKRDSSDQADGKIKQAGRAVKMFFRNDWKGRFADEKQIKQFRDYFKSLIKEKEDN